MSDLKSVFKSSYKFRIYLFKYLPTVLFWGLKIEKIDENKCIISIKYNRRTQNPFRSIYFSALAGAAELSTGIPAILSTEDKNISMLVIGVEGRFFKKAIGRIDFICEDVKLIKKAIDEAGISEAGKELRVKSIGKNEQNETVAEFFLTWSFKKRK